eukprot:sb/3467511/
MSSYIPSDMIPDEHCVAESLLPDILPDMAPDMAPDILPDTTPEESSGWIKHNSSDEDPGSYEDTSWYPMNHLGCSRDSLEIHRKNNPEWWDWGKEDPEPKKDKSVIKRLKSLIAKTKHTRKKSVTRPLPCTIIAMSSYIPSDMIPDEHCVAESLLPDILPDMAPDMAPDILPDTTPEESPGWIKHNSSDEDPGSYEDTSWYPMNHLGCSKDSLEIHRKNNPEWWDWGKEDSGPKKDKSVLKRLKSLVAKTKLVRKKSVTSEVYDCAYANPSPDPLIKLTEAGSRRVTIAGWLYL